MSPATAAQSPTTLSHRLMWVIAGALCFGAIAWFSLSFAREAGRVAAIWPANGILLALILLRPASERDPLLLGAFFGNIGVGLAHGDALTVAVGLALANATEVFIATKLLTRNGRITNLNRPHDLGRFAIFAGLIAPICSTLIATTTLFLFHSEPLLPNVSRWFLADALGLLITAPPILIAANPDAWRRRTSLAQRALLFGILGVTLGVVFLQRELPLLFLVPPVLILIAFQSGSGSAAVALMLATVASLAAVVAGSGPIALVDGGLDQRALVQQLFLATLVFTTIPVATILSEQARAKRQLAANEQRFRQLADQASDIITVCDMTSEFGYFSPSVTRVLGWRPDEMVGKPSFDFVHPEDLRRLKKSLAAGVPAVSEGRTQTVRYRARHKDGHYVWLEANPAVLHDPDGNPVAVQDSIRDVTEAVALEEAREEARRHAEAAARAKSDFLANMSHELRTPLTGVIGFSDLLQQSQDLGPKERMFADRIASSGRALLAVINDILDFSKLEAGAVELDTKPFDVRHLAEGSMAIMEGLAREKDVRLHIDIAPEVPARLVGDDTRLRQVLLNLLSNAIKFSPKGDVTLRIAYPDKRLCVEVIDTGAGIPPEKINRLFERFTQADSSTTRNNGGTGLGLAICRALVDAMGGDINATSAPGQGSTFWFEVPLPAAEALAASDSETRAPAATTAPEQGLSVLVADDAPANRELLRTILESWDVGVTLVEDGAQAVTAARTGTFDVILMDMHMPVMDGLDATRTIRALPGAAGQVPIIALTANTQADQVAACLAAGMDAHVAKPIDVARLATTLSQLAESGRAATSAAA